LIAPSESRTVAITGVGILTPLGDTLAGVVASLCAGRSSIAPVQSPTPAAESRFVDFEATRYANVRGMRIYNRSTRLGICATRLALLDAGLENSGFPGEQLGVVMASTFGHFDTLIEYDRSLYTQGPARTNPALMPLAIPSAPGAMIALSFGAKACSITLADGGAGALDALGLAARLTRAGRVGACIVVAALGLFDELILSASRAGQLAPPEAFRVFDQRSGGTAFGEAGVAVIVETMGHARARGATPKGFVAGQASTYTAGPERMESSLARACSHALSKAGLESHRLGLVISGANGSPLVDRAEARALFSVLGESSGQPVVTAIKAALGDMLDASGLIQTIVAMSVLAGTLAPPIARLGEVAFPGLRYLTEPSTIEQGHALITGTSHTGACSALVISREARAD
jgi:3-oxoacyl-[acyl-carrier-protein] synthase II